MRVWSPDDRVRSIWTFRQLSEMLNCSIEWIAELALRRREVDSYDCVEEIREMARHGILTEHIRMAFRVSKKAVAEATIGLEVASVCGPGIYESIADEHERLSQYLDLLDNPERFKRVQALARSVAYLAIKRGRLERQPCEMGSDCKGQIHAHHEDYTKPLRVRWVCHKHHFEEHARLRRLKKAAA